LTHANSRNRFISAWNMLHQAGSFELAAYEYLRQLASGNGSTRAALTGGILRTVPVPLPRTLDEQREIVEILDALDRRISLHQRKRIVLEELFKALLHKLMTGEIRVADLDRSVFGNTSGCCPLRRPHQVARAGLAHAGIGQDVHLAHRREADPRTKGSVSQCGTVILVVDRTELEGVNFATSL
jgi:hypothetical protein